MDKVIENTSFGNHELKMIDRGILTLTGINKIDSFDNEEFLLESNMGHLHIKGEQLELVKLDTHDGNVKIKGKTYKASKAIVKGLEILPSVDAPIFLRDKIGFPDYYKGTSMIFKVVNE